MKHTFAIVLLLSIFCSCKRNEAIRPDPFNSEVEIAALAKDSQFVAFSKNYLHTFIEYSLYQKQALGAQETPFLTELRAASNDAGVAEKIYSRYPIDFNIALGYQNKLDNQLHQFLVSRQELSKHPPEEIKQILLAALTTGIQSGTHSWADINSDLVAQSHRLDRLNPKSYRTHLVDEENDLTGPEVWDCLKRAVGIYCGSQLIIVGIEKASIKLITMAATKLAAKFCGPIGTAIMIADLSFCLYEQYND